MARKKDPTRPLVKKDNLSERIDFDSILAGFRCPKKTFPKSNPRFGATVERFFKKTHQRFINTLPANDDNNKIAQLHRTKSARAKAVWTLDDCMSTAFRNFKEKRR